jgi:hypothetical protein
MSDSCQGTNPLAREVAGVDAGGQTAPLRTA